MKQQHVAVVTGASSGLGAAVAEGLARQGWSLVIDGRDPGPLTEEAERLRAIQGEADGASDPGGVGVASVVGDVTDPDHRRQLAATVQGLGRVDLVVLNASILGPSPQPELADYPLDVLRAVYEVNAIAPLAILQDLTPWLRAAPAPRVIAVTSDAAVEPYAGWGRLRLVQGRAGADQRHLGGGTTMVPDMDGRPRGSVHPAPPAGISGRGHLRPARTGHRRARGAHPDRIRSPERPGSPGRHLAGIIR